MSFFGESKENVFSKKTDSALGKYKDKEEVKIVGIPTFQIHFREDSGFGIYSCETAEEIPFLIKGTFVAELVIGQTYHFNGSVCTYKGEKQLNVSNSINVKPVNKKGIISYLMTLKGLKSKAEWIYAEFGDKSIDMLIQDPMLVASKIKGIGKKSVIDWQKQLAEMKDSQLVLMELLSYGLKIKEARKLYEKYGENIVEKIKMNPYFLALEVRGYGFETCDRLARKMGFDCKSNFRIQEGIIHILEKASLSGHCYLPKDILVKYAKELLTIKLTAQEMYNFIVQKSSAEVFPYPIGDKDYPINYKELVNLFDLYKREQNKEKKDQYRYKVVTFTDEEIKNGIEEVIEQNRVIPEEIADFNMEESQLKEGNEDSKIKLYLRNLFYDEKKVAKRVLEIVASEKSLNVDLEKELNALLNFKAISLEEKQREAVLTFANSIGGFFVLNGSAGCGKTFTLNIILELLNILYKKNGDELKVKVFAPTGKASKVASKSTGRVCKTVHRGLGYHPPYGFEYNETNFLYANCIVVDESSMLDISLTRSLLEAIKNGTKVIFLGDTKQLPSVGAGNVLHDLIESGTIKIVTLNVVKRQGLDSGVIKNANKIINGEMIESCEDTQDAYVLYRETPMGTVKTIVESMRRILNMDGYGFEDVQVLCPQKTSTVGTYYLNYVLQKEFNPENNGIKVLNTKFQIQTDTSKKTEEIKLYFKKGDKVIHMKNNYDMEWYNLGLMGDYKKINPDELIGITNGECGVIHDIIKFKEGKDSDEITRIIVRYEDKYVFYDDRFDELEHSYAMTIHKSQGSQWKAVIIPIMYQNFKMLDNNLFYTGYTRAESFSVVVGQKKAIAHAIKTHKSRERYTGLAYSLDLTRFVA